MAQISNIFEKFIDWFVAQHGFNTCFNFYFYLSHVYPSVLGIKYSPLNVGGLLAIPIVKPLTCYL